MTLAIDVHDLVKRYGTRTVVDRFSLQVERGRICGFLGPSLKRPDGCPRDAVGRQFHFLEAKCVPRNRRQSARTSP